MPPGLAYAIGQGAVPGQPHRQGHPHQPCAPAVWRPADGDDDHALARPVQHHDLWPGRPLPRGVRPAPGGLHQRRGPGAAGPGGGATRRHHQRLGRRRTTPGRGLRAGRIRHPARVRRGVLPRDQSPGAAGEHRRWLRHAHVQVGAGAADTLTAPANRAELIPRPRKTTHQATDAPGERTPLPQRGRGVELPQALHQFSSRHPNGIHRTGRTHRL
ncbi:hypothetical protein CBM2599_B50960 [Cupriavidus taiwanensis]|nr:hypothetical protein CBM2600_B10030 [Cupriavidus taiwanensis]SOY97214.1 hypothetical protein CBM2599_B50960 [Cupriavidus taiwanensis]